MTQLDSRAPMGEQIIGRAPQHDGKLVTTIGAFGVQGAQAVMTVEQSTDAEVFRTYIKRLLDPPLTPVDMVVLDDLSVHNATGAQSSLAHRQAQLRFLPPYSPDVSPIKPYVRQLKTALRAAKAHTREALESTIWKAVETMTAAEIWNRFKHCGYALS
jgi:transposase